VFIGTKMRITANASMPVVAVLLARRAAALIGCNRTEHTPKRVAQTEQTTSTLLVPPAGYVYIPTMAKARCLVQPAGRTVALFFPAVGKSRSGERSTGKSRSVRPPVSLRR